MSSNLPTIAKELSWLSFNERVLQEAADASVPEIQRLRYLGIYSNNMDEFFRVRVADVRRLATYSKGEAKQQFNELLEEIQQKVEHLHDEFENVYLAVLRSLAKRKIYLIDEKQLDASQAAYVDSYFKNKLFPVLSPFLLEDQLSLPPLDDGQIYFAIKLVLDDDTSRYGIVQIPTDRMNRFVEIPQRQGKNQKGSHVFIVQDNIIRHCLSDVFMGIFPVKKAEAFTFKITRDAELELDDGISQSLLDKVTKSLQKRKKADAVRFVYDETMPDDLLDALKRKLGVGHYDSLMPSGRYHNSKDFMDFPSVGPQYLQYRPLPRVEAKYKRDCSIFCAIRDKDIAIYYPYHSFSLIVNFLKTAAVDPKVQSISICLYRVAKQSQIVDALINAVRNGKTVTAVVELQARFDEQNNIEWAQRLTEAGVQVIFGVPGLKVHAKAILVTRLEKNTLRYYTHVGTGNFNEKTANLYTDISLLTYNQEIGKDMENLFRFLGRNYLRMEYQHLCVSPHSNRSNLVSMIEQETRNAKKGKRAEIIFKCNNLVDNEVIEKLYEASQAGVKVRLIIRGMCGLIPGLKMVSENIEGISIVDRYLEHPRIYIFHNNGEPRYFISSADLMTRNLDYRVEISCPVYDKDAQKLIRTIIETQWKDNVKARVLNAGMTNERSKRGKRKLRSQEVLHDKLEKL